MSQKHVYLRRKGNKHDNVCSITNKRSVKLVIGCSKKKEFQNFLRRNLEVENTKLFITTNIFHDRNVIKLRV